MFLINIIIFTVIIGLPIALGLWSRIVIRKHTEDPTADFYKEQLQKLTKDRDINLLDDTQYDHARIEIERRLLNHSLTPPAVFTSAGITHKIILFGALLSIPMIALILYALNGVPSLDPQPSPQPTQTDTSSIAVLERTKNSIAHLPINDPNYVSQHILLGQMEEHLNFSQEAIHDWNLALSQHFSPELALQIAETMTKSAGHVTHESLNLYQQALTASPQNAPWRSAIESRISEGKQLQDHQAP